MQLIAGCCLYLVIHEVGVSHVELNVPLHSTLIPDRHTCFHDTARRALTEGSYEALDILLSQKLHMILFVLENVSN